MVVDANTALTNLLVDKRNDFNKKMTAVNRLSRNEGWYEGNGQAARDDARAPQEEQENFPELFSSAYQFYSSTMSTDLPFLGLDPKRDFAWMCARCCTLHQDKQAQGSPTNGRHIVP
jgi:hypothetical protein